MVNAQPTEPAMPSQPSDSKQFQCPACGEAVASGMPACTSCGEQLFVEHPASMPRDSTAVDQEAFRSSPGGVDR